MTPFGHAVVSLTHLPNSPPGRKVFAFDGSEATMNVISGVASPGDTGGGIVIRPLGPILGAEVVGADLSMPVSDRNFRLFKEALNEYKVLVYRDQHLTKQQLVDFSKG